MADGANEGGPLGTAREFLRSLDRPGPLVVAVSGGGDSMALLNACHQVARDGTIPGRRLIAATVDHGLRAGSDREAREVGSFCAALGVQHEILTWTGEKPATGMQAAARLARYRLLAGLCARAGAIGVATAHTRDDQAETVAMRAERQAGDGHARGLAGMASATLFDASCWILRPFLSLGRDELRQWLCERRVGWIEDPSNEDERFERVRVRRSGQAAALPAAAEDRRASRRRTGEAVASAIEARGRVDAGFLASLDLAGQGGMESAVHDAAALLLSIAGGRPYLPGRETRRRLADFLAAGTAGRFSAARAIAEIRDGRVHFYRERRNLPFLHLAPGESGLYDGRYRVTATGGSAVGLAAAGGKAVAALRNLPELSGIPPGVAGRALAAEPVFRHAGREHFAWQADASDLRVVRHLALFDVFLPLFDYIVANRCGALYGRAAYPPPPSGALTA